ncbi:hypothetical protein WEH80_12995 [Actinomycetes bacterium KLBMP 9759]
MPSTPPRPRGPRTRTTGIRRPRVAGTTPAPETTAAKTTGVAVGEERAPQAPVTTKSTVVLEKPSGKAAAKQASAKPDSAAVGTGEEKKAPAQVRKQPWVVPALVGAVVLFTGLAANFGIAAAALRFDPAAANTALVDPAATAQVSGELSDALVSIYSYDFARLDENEKAALAVSTPAYAEKYKQVFGVIREQAPKLQAVMSAVVRKAAVQSIDGDRAVLVAFIDQRGVRVDTDGKQKETSAPGRVEVIGERVEGKWKVADVIVE